MSQRGTSWDGGRWRPQADLPDGAEVRVALVDDDDLDDSERAKLHAAILAGEAEIDAGQAVSEGELWSRLRAIR